MLRHGMHKSPEYQAWLDMRRRCGNPTHKDYRHYGGRGITVCPAWLQSFNTFLADMGSRPTGLTLERIDNDRGYEPGNCKWATRKEQRHNSRPPVCTNGGDKYRLTSLEVGASLVVENTPRKALRGAIGNYSKSRGMKFTTSQVGRDAVVTRLL